MGSDTYTSVPLDDGLEGYGSATETWQRSPRLERAMRGAFVSLLTVVVFLLGFAAGDRYGRTAKAVVAVGESNNNGTLSSPQPGAAAFVPDSESSLQPAGFGEKTEGE
jgi:hypothetical protein